MADRKRVPLTDTMRKIVSDTAPHLAHVTEGYLVNHGCFSTVVSIEDEIVIKYGKEVSLVEAATLQFVTQNTGVPVPTLLRFCRGDVNGYLVLKYVPGECLQDVWDSLTPAEKDFIVGELTEYFRELHSLTGTYIGSVGRQPPRDLLFTNIHPSGPYETEREMNEAIIRASRPRWKQRGGSPLESFMSTILPCLPKDHKIVFCHGQVHIFHIVIDMTEKKVAGIVGWSQAGFYPEHWDFVNALVQISWRSDWIKFIPVILEPFYKEYALWHRIRQMVMIGLKRAAPNRHSRVRALDSRNLVP